jgi:hypothetical protein
MVWQENENCPQSLTLAVERDSVCMADDINAPHAVRVSICADSSLAQVLQTVLEPGYLPQIAGGLATWIVESDKPLAVIAQQWRSPRFLIDPNTRIARCVPLNNPRPLFFRYWCQVDPNAVFKCLKAGDPLPDKYERYPPAP